MSRMIDIHAHPQMKPFNSNLTSREQKGIWKEFSESSSCETLNNLLRGAVNSTTKRSQTNLEQALRGNVGGIFLAMGPVERNFFAPQRKHLIIKLILSGKRMPDFAACVTGFDIEKVKKIFSRIQKKRGLDYYREELLEEYDFLLEQDTDARMCIAGDYNEFSHNFNRAGVVSTLLTIEGAHSLGNYEQHADFKLNIADADRPEIYNRLMPDFEKNILHMKKWGNGRHAPFFITFCHHFGNLLAGHAKSFASGTFIKPGMDDLLDQLSCKNQGFSRLGSDVMELLLSKNNGRRVLIDVKHMSVQARKEFFAMLEKKFWSKGEKLPVICSHAALSGYKSLEESNVPDTRYTWQKNYLSRQAINMSDEEARIIARSGGLVGIVFHGGRLPGGLAKNQLSEAYWSRNNDKIRDVAIKLIMSNIFQFIRAAGYKEAWDSICLGTDMDGVIEPLRPYTNYTSLWGFSQHLVQFFRRPFDLAEIGLNAQEVKNLMFGYEPEILADKILFQNVLDFLKKYFNDTYLGGERLTSRRF